MCLCGNMTVFEAKLHDNEFYYVKTQQTGLYQAVGPVFR